MTEELVTSIRIAYFVESGDMPDDAVSRMVRRMLLEYAIDKVLSSQPSHNHTEIIATAIESAMADIAAHVSGE